MVIDGTKAIIKSTNNSFEDITANYCEVIIIPEDCKEYIVENDSNEEVMIMQAYVRTK
jgi:hypothetical protein